MGRKYSTLEGKKVIMEWNDVEHKCVITGADWSVGLTIQEEGTKRYMFCENGPKSPVMKGKEYNWGLHRDAMGYIYDNVKAGRPLLQRDILAIYKKNAHIAGMASAEMCAFSQ